MKNGTELNTNRAKERIIYTEAKVELGKGGEVGVGDEGRVGTENAR